MRGLDAAAEDAMGGFGDSAPLLSETSFEDAAGEFLLRLQRQTGIPAAALLPLILSLSSIAAILLCQALFALLVRVAFGDARRGGATSSGSVLLLGVCGAVLSYCQQVKQAHLSMLCQALSPACLFPVCRPAGCCLAPLPWP